MEETVKLSDPSFDESLHVGAISCYCGSTLALVLGFCVIGLVSLELFRLSAHLSQRGVHLERNSLVLIEVIVLIVILRS